MKKLVVYSFACGNVISLPEITFVHPSIDYVMFTDADIIDDRGWNLVKITIPDGQLVYDYNRGIKWSPHMLFGKYYEYSMYVDCVVEFKPEYNPLFFLQRHLINDRCGVNMQAYRRGGECDGTSRIIETCIRQRKGNMDNIVKYMAHLSELPTSVPMVSVSNVMIISTIKSNESKKLQAAILNKYLEWGILRDEITMAEAVVECGHEMDELANLGNNVFHDGLMTIRSENYVRADDYTQQSSATPETVREWVVAISEHMIPLLKRLAHKPKIVCSMTTHPPRLSACVKSLKNMMYCQTMPADKYILHLSDTEFPNGTPDEFKELVEDGLQIKWVDNTGPFKKFESIAEHIDDFNVMVDDDIYYPMNFIEEMVTKAKLYPHSVFIYLTNKPVLGAPSGKNEFASGNTIIPPRCWPLHTLDMIKEAYELVPTDDESFFYPWLLYHGFRIGCVNNVYKWVFIDDSQRIGLLYINNRNTGTTPTRLIHIYQVLEKYPHIREAYERSCHPNRVLKKTQTGSTVPQVGENGCISRMQSRGITTPEGSEIVPLQSEYVKILKSWKPTTTGITLPIR